MAVPFGAAISALSEMQTSDKTRDPLPFERNLYDRIPVDGVYTAESKHWEEVREVSAFEVAVMMGESLSPKQIELALEGYLGLFDLKGFIALGPNDRGAHPQREDMTSRRARLINTNSPYTCPWPVGTRGLYRGDKGYSLIKKLATYRYMHGMEVVEYMAASNNYQPSPSDLLRETKRVGAFFAGY